MANGNAYNQIYNRLVNGNNDAVGMFAYAIYKQQKIAFLESIRNTRNNEPTSEEIDAFHRTSMLELTINGYREQAEALVTAFLNEALNEKIEQIQDAAKESVIISHLNDIKLQVTEKRTLKGWLADVTSTVINNILTIALIGFIMFGYNQYSVLNQKTEQAVGLENQPSQK